MNEIFNQHQRNAKPAPKPARQPTQPAPAPAPAPANVALPARVVDNPKSQDIQEIVNIFMETPYWKDNFIFQTTI